MKYRHWLERAGVTLLRTDVTLLPVHTGTQCHYVMVLRYMSVPTLKGNVYQNHQTTVEELKMEIENAI